MAGRKRARDEEHGRGIWDGKRGKGRGDSTGSETDESVRAIPMPRDTPPPLPRTGTTTGRGNANMEPLGGGGGGGGGEGRNGGRRESRAVEGQEGEALDLSLPSKPVLGFSNTSGGGGGRMVYEAKPQVRDLRKEATARFVPVAVRKNIDATKGKGRLLEEEEVEVLERAGYGYQGGTTEGYNGKGNDAVPDVRIGDAGEMERERRRLLEEEERFAREMAMEDVETGGAAQESTSLTTGRDRAVQMEDVEDEDL